MAQKPPKKNKKDWDDMSRKEKALGVIILVVIAIVIIGVIGAIFGGGDNSKKASKKANDNHTKQAKVENKPKKKEPTVAEKPKAQASTISKLWTAVDKSINSRDGIDISYNKKTKTAHLTHYESEFINTKDTVGEAYRDFVQWGEKIKNMPGVKTIDVATQTDFTDSHGKTDKENACEVTMGVANFKKYNWDSLNGQPIHNQLYQDGTLIIQVGS